MQAANYCIRKIAIKPIAVAYPLLSPRVLGVIMPKIAYSLSFWGLTMYSSFYKKIDIMHMMSFLSEVMIRALSESYRGAAGFFVRYHKKKHGGFVFDDGVGSWLL